MTITNSPGLRSPLANSGEGEAGLPPGSASPITLSPVQVELARHALGLPNKSKRSYRNRFVVGPSGPNHAAWMQMVAVGAAERESGSPFDWFFLTRSGAEAALLPRERLCSEDFPQEAA